MTELEKAARQALEALEKTMGVWGGTCAWHLDVEQAITALRRALEQQARSDALDKMAENARELGLNYEPVAMRHSFDGYGWKYTDSGFGSDWKEWTLKQHPDAEPVYERPQPAAPAIPEGMALVPKRMTKAMHYVTDQEDWTWEDLLRAAEAITEAEYNLLAAALEKEEN